MKMEKLRGMNALVSSGGQGIGKEIALELVRHGCNVVVSYLSSRNGAGEIALEAEKHQCRATSFRADLSRKEDVENLVADATRFLGGLDILVNNAGNLVGRRTLPEVDEKFWREVMDINLKSMLLLTQAALPYLKKARNGASIVNLSSLAGRKGGHGGSLVYSTAKGAVLTWTRALAAELGRDGIRVNALAPGLILGSSFHTTHTTDESARQTISQIPLNRAGTPADVARAALFLASEFDGFITGATLDINGGIYCA